MSIEGNIKKIFEGPNPMGNFDLLIKETPLSELPEFNLKTVHTAAEFLPKPEEKTFSVAPSKWIDKQTWNKIAYIALACFTWPFNFSFILERPKNYQQVTRLYHFYYAALLLPFKTVRKVASSLSRKAKYNATIIMIGLISLSILAKFIESQTGIIRKADLDEKSYRNLNADVADNKIALLTNYRSDQIHEIALSLTDSGIETGACGLPILVGRPGTGKTAAVSNLVYLIQNMNIYPQLKDKTFFAINARQWASQNEDSDIAFGEDAAMEASLYAFLDIIKGAEKDTVLFIDEAHSLSNGCINLLKTYMEEKELKLIFATTENEFQEKFAQNLAFIDRLKKIEFLSLPNIETKSLLQTIFSPEKAQVQIEESAFDVIIQAGHTLKDYAERANPRKSLQLTGLLIKEARSWMPTVIHSQKQSMEQQVAALKNAAARELLEAGKISDEITNKLAELEGGIKELEEKIPCIQALYQQIRDLQDYKRQQQQTLCRMVHKISGQPADPSELDKKYYLMTQIAIQALSDLIKEKTEYFSELSTETYPLSLTSELVKKFLKIENS